MDPYGASSGPTKRQRRDGVASLRIRWLWLDDRQHCFVQRGLRLYGQASPMCPAAWSLLRARTHPKWRTPPNKGQTSMSPCASSERALTLRAHSLSRTNAALQDPSEAIKDEVLASCRVLSLFEMLNQGQSTGGPDQITSWQNHIVGATKMVQLRGFDRHVSGHGLDLYDSVRITAVIQGIARRAPNAFLELDWSPPQVTLRDWLYNIAGGLPRLLQTMDQLCARMEVLGNHDEGTVKRTVDLAQSVIVRILALGDMLRGWETEALDLCRQKASSSSTSDCDSHWHDLVNQVQLLDVCTSHGDGFFSACVQYWTFSIKTYSSARVFHRRIIELLEFKMGGAQSALQPLPTWVDPEPHALNIASTASHFFRPEAGLWGAQCAVFPVGSALFYFAATGRRESEPFRMLTSSFAQSKTGAVMRDFLDKIVNSGGR
ncbi:hypothetical protein LTR53_010890 [Teratosphaeriaceae sp. CCFEE 6253]|nr:hypothetical protein LTR53_010890 [Teratosphaeriaceae sp. CCFEE 6253]